MREGSVASGTVMFRATLWSIAELLGRSDRRTFSYSAEDRLYIAHKPSLPCN